MFLPFILAAALAPAALACPDHDNGQIYRRDTPEADLDAPKNVTRDWEYSTSFNWGKINPKYYLCQNGTQQSPIGLSDASGLALKTAPKFNYTGAFNGTWYNWGFGPAWSVAHDGDWTKHPSMTFDNKTVYLKGWHIHSPAEHVVNGARARAELHMVHVDGNGNYAAVLGIRLDPGVSNNTFFSQLPSIIPFTDTDTKVNSNVTFTGILGAASFFNEFWTYQGSLTSPPCNEGLRWFVAKQTVLVGTKQLQAILGASTYSTRAEQPIWEQAINQ